MSHQPFQACSAAFCRRLCAGEFGQNSRAAPTSWPTSLSWSSTAVRSATCLLSSTEATEGCFSAETCHGALPLVFRSVLLKAIAQSSAGVEPATPTSRPTSLKFEFDPPPFRRTFLVAGG